MEQVVILLLFVVASIVSSIIQNRNKRQAEEEEAARRSGGAPRRAESKPKPPFEQWPKTARDWQEELRRMLEEAAGVEKPVPPIVPPQQKPKLPATRSIPVSKVSGPAIEAEAAEGDLILASRLRDSEAAYARASGLHDRVQDRLREVAQATETHKRQAERSAATRSPWAERFRDRRMAREAFVASVILSPPVAFQAFDGVGAPRV